MSNIVTCKLQKRMKKMALKSSKNEIFQNIICSVYVALSLDTKNKGCRSSGVACGEYKDKEGKKRPKNERRP